MSPSILPPFDFCGLAALVHFRAPLKSSLLLLFFQIEFLLLGTVLAACLGPRRSARFSLPDLGFIGLCAAVAFGQIWSLFGGLRPFSNMVLLVVAAVIAFLRYRQLIEIVGAGAKETRWRGLILVLPLWLVGTFNALTNGFCYDGALYHLAAVRWVWEYGTVPGLANLHGRLGFNSSLSALAALLGVPSGLRLGQEFVNPSLVILAAGVVSQGLFGKGSAPGDFPRTIYALSLFAFLGGLIFSPCLSSPQPDIGGAAIAVLVAWYFREIFFRDELTTQQNTNFLFLCLSAVVLAIQIKLSYLALGLATAAIAPFLFWLRFRSVSPLVPVSLWAGALLIPWVCCGYVTSGYPLFPSELARLNFDWTVPNELIERERDWALSWARNPGLPPEIVLRSWAWLGPWFSSLWQDPGVIRPLVLTVVGLLLFLVGRSWRCERQNLWKWFVFITPSFLGLIFWFFTAPAPRFAEATLWIFGANVLICPLAVSAQTSKIASSVAGAVVLSLLSYDAGVGLGRLGYEGEKLPNFVGGRPVMTLRLTRSGLGVWLPTPPSNPGDWELVSTPLDRFDSRLELRGPTLRQGFRIRDRENDSLQ
jgi:hypothetical protein